MGRCLLNDSVDLVIDDPSMMVQKYEWTVDWWGNICQFSDHFKIGEFDQFDVDEINFLSSLTSTEELLVFILIFSHSNLPIFRHT